MNGITLIVLAYPSGWIADRFSRDRTLRVAGGIGFVAVVFSLYAFSSDSLPLVALCMAMWGVYAGACVCVLHVYVCVWYAYVCVWYAFVCVC